MIYILQLIIFCLLFNALVAIGTGGKAINVLFFYPKTVQKKAIEVGLTTEEEIKRKKKHFMIPFMLIMMITLFLILGLWNRVSSFKSAYLESLMFLLVMNWYDGFVIDKLWVGKSKFWVIPELGDIPYIQSWKEMFKKRILWSVIYAIVALIVAALVLLIF